MQDCTHSVAKSEVESRSRATGATTWVTTPFLPPEVPKLLNRGNIGFAVPDHILSPVEIRAASAYLYGVCVGLAWSLECANRDCPRHGPTRRTDLLGPLAGPTRLANSPDWLPLPPTGSHSLRLPAIGSHCLLLPFMSLRGFGASS